MNARDAGTLLGVAIDRKPLEQLVDDALDAITRRGPRVTFACANPHSLVTAQEDSFFLRALNHASHVVADGVGVLMMARMEVGPRITGSDFFSGVMESLERRGGGRVFFFGSSQRVLDLIAERCVREYPHVIVCGMLSPPYRQWSDEENEAMLMQINNARPDVLWVGMTAPKQEKWVEANQGRLHTPVVGCIGAVFDFYAGTYPRAPQWMCRAGIEWLYRLLKEPQRMWRRNLISSPLFVLLVLRRHLFRLHA